MTAAITTLLNSAQQAQIFANDEQTGANVISTAQAGAAQPSSSRFVYFAAFDGSNNDAHPKDGRTTNVAQLFEQSDADQANFKSKYFPGPGTLNRPAFCGGPLV